MTSTDPDRNSALEALAADLGGRYADIETEISVFPSGAVFLDVRRGGRAWVLAYSPTHDQFGVDELGDHDGFTTSYAYTTTQVELAADILIDLIAGTQGSGPSMR